VYARRMRTRLAALVVSLVAAGAARANSPPPATYWIHEGQPGKVWICPSMGPACPERVLLRRDVGSGEIVSVTACVAVEPQCYLDECVPAGTYQYGFAVPYRCEETGSYFYEQIEAQGAPPGCTRTGPAPAPAASVPWSSRQVICRSTYGHSDGGCSTLGGVVGLNLLAVGLGLGLLRRGRRR